MIEMSILNQKYQIKYVLSDLAYVNYYIATLANDKKWYLVCEFTSRVEIDVYIKDFLLMRKSNHIAEFVECFVENLNFYAVFVYTKGQMLEQYLHQKNYPIRYRYTLMKSILLKVFEYQDSPDMIRRTILKPGNIVIAENLISFNFRVDMEHTDFYDDIANLLYYVFSTKEIHEHQRLNIINNKCRNNIYKAYGELIKDIEDFGNVLERDEDLRDKLIQNGRKKFASLLKIVVAISIVFAFVVLVNGYLKNEGMPVYKDVEEIGTVVIHPNLE